MTSTQLINRLVIGGRAITDPVAKRVKTKSGETTVTTFILAVTGGSPVRIEIEAWSSVATVAQMVHKGRRVIVDGRLSMNEFLRDDQKQRRHLVRADSVSFLDDPSKADGDHE